MDQCTTYFFPSKAHISPFWKPAQSFHFGSIDFHFGSIDFHFNWILFPFWKWYPTDLEMVSTWFGNGIHLIWKWYPLDLEMISTWFGYCFQSIWKPFSFYQMFRNIQLDSLSIWGNLISILWRQFLFQLDTISIFWKPFPNQLGTISKSIGYHFQKMEIVSN